MFRPCVDAEHIGDLAQRVPKGIPQAEGICHLGSPCACRQNTSYGKSAYDLDQKKGQQAGSPFQQLPALLKQKDQQKQRKQGHVAFVYKAYPKVEHTGKAEVYLAVLLIEIPEQIPEYHNGHPQSHGLHKPQHLSNLVISHAAD